MYLAIHCYAFHATMPELRRQEMQRTFLGELGVEDCEIDYGVDIHGQPLTLDAWLLTILESERINEKRSEIANSRFPYLQTRTIQPQDIW